MYIAVFSHDAITLLHAMTELERFAPIAPKLRLCKAIGEAWLEYLRGKPERAVALFERVLHTDDARQLPSWIVDRGLYAAALNAAGQHARAREVCVELLGPPPYHESAIRRVTALPQLALAEAGLGNHPFAATLMDDYFASIEASGNALQLGNAHRDRARIATLAGDKAAYELHFAAMKRSYATTQNSSLISQIDLTESAAQRSGISGSSGRVVRPQAAIDDFDSTTVLEQHETHERSTVVRERR
jgi:hypothetical protein